MGARALSRGRQFEGPEATAPLNVAAALSRLLPELTTLRTALVGDIQRAEQRGFRQLASDLRSLAQRVDAVLEAARVGHNEMRP
jgi:hypothetical protein